MKSLPLLIVAVGLLSFDSVLAAEQRITCPTRLEPDAVHPRNPPSGWELYMSRPVYLTEGGMLHGPPDESAYLVPDRSTHRKAENHVLESQHWSFDVPHGYTMWAFCGYGHGATLKLFKKVSESATECTLSSKAKDERTKESIDFSCR